MNKGGPITSSSHATLSTECERTVPLLTTTRQYVASFSSYIATERLGSTPTHDDNHQKRKIARHTRQTSQDDYICWSYYRSLKQDMCTTASSRSRTEGARALCSPLHTILLSFRFWRMHEAAQLVQNGTLSNVMTYILDSPYKLL